MSVLKAKIKIIYIAGYGFSGSTLLERMIAMHSQIVGCGEVHNILHDFELNETCSCGLSLSSCPHWKEVYAKYLKNKKSINDLNIFSVMAEDQNPDLLYFCDSSKTTFGNMIRPYLLSKKYDIKLIHLTRNGIACLNSVLKRNSQFGYLVKSMVVAIHWSLANITAYSFKFFKPTAYHKIAYEHLLGNPDTHINGIYKFLKINSQSNQVVNLKKTTIPRTHQLSGNAIRRTENLLLKTGNQANQKTTVLSSLIFKVVSFPVYKLMGY